MAATKATMTTNASPAKVRLTDGLGHNAQNAERWYCVSRDGLATLCKDEADAHETSGQCDKSWPLGGPHSAVRLADASEIERLRDALGELRERIKGHPAYADLTEDEETDIGGDTAELSYLARVADVALRPNV